MKIIKQKTDEHLYLVFQSSAIIKKSKSVTARDLGMHLFHFTPYNSSIDSIGINRYDSVDPITLKRIGTGMKRSASSRLTIGNLYHSTKSKLANYFLNSTQRLSLSQPTAYPSPSQRHNKHIYSHPRNHSTTPRTHEPLRLIESQVSGHSPSPRTISSSTGARHADAKQHTRGGWKITTVRAGKKLARASTHKRDPRDSSSPRVRASCSLQRARAGEAEV